MNSAILRILRDRKARRAHDRFTRSLNRALDRATDADVAYVLPDLPRTTPEQDHALEVAADVAALRRDAEIWAVSDALGLTRPRTDERVYAELLADRAVTACPA